MNLYIFAVPDVANNKRTSYGAARNAWLSMALAKAGGYTTLGLRSGQWRDPETGFTYAEKMHAYQVACSAEVKVELLAAAFELFPDQLAIFVAHIGSAEIVDRPKV